MQLAAEVENRLGITVISHVLLFLQYTVLYIYLYIQFLYMYQLRKN